MALPNVSNKKRLFALLVVVALFFLLLTYKLADVVFVKGEWLQQKAEGQWTRDLSVAAKRGAILDRNGHTLAQSANADTVVLRPGQITDPQALADAIAPILGMETEKEKNSIVTKASDKTKSEVWLKRQISREQANALRMLALPDVHLTVDIKRYYPNKDFLTQILGFTTVDGVGQEGLEARYDKYLKGQEGKIISQADQKGREIPLSEELFIPAKDGYNIVLTIDEVIQSFLEKACKEAIIANKAKSVQGIVVDPKTGEILALANIPEFDLNAPPRDSLETLRELSRNRVVVDVYEPGSTFKIITTAAALDSGAATLETKFNCPGFRLVDGQKISCWRVGRPHGTQDLTQAVQNSCNPCFMDMALAMGKEKFYEYIYNFGFGTLTGIDYSADQGGIVQPVKYVKNVDLARIGFGQSIAVTPLQLVMGTAAVVNGGSLMKPYLVKRFEDADKNVIKEFSPTVVRQAVSPETSKTMCGILESVVSVGTGKNAYIPGYRVGGKTGTAQKYIDGAVSRGKHISSFIGFAPADDAQILALIVVDEPNVPVDFGSIVAAPYVKMVMQDTLKYLNVKPVYKENEKQPVKVKVPDVRGMTIEAAAVELRKAGLEYLADGQGSVNTQLPAPETEVDEHTDILLYMSIKNEDSPDENLVQVPDLKGKSINEAQQILKGLGLTLQIEGSGVAVYQKPTAKEIVPKGSAVRVQFEKPD